jgi:hypothetical protein
MPKDGQCQYPCGPFLPGELPTYQAAAQHAKMHWRPYLTRTQYEIIDAVIDRTARFGNQSRVIPTVNFFSGVLPNVDTNFAGCAPLTTVSNRTFYASLKELERLRILLREGKTLYGLDYSITAMDLVTDPETQRRVLQANSRRGALGDIRGLIEDATNRINFMVADRDIQRV